MTAPFRLHSFGPTQSTGSVQLAGTAAEWILLLVIGVFAFVGGCRGKNDQPASTLDTVTLKMGSKNFRLEIAATERSRAFGLMDRSSLPADAGMIFVFSNEEPRAFYMKRTLIPLDIVYINAAGRIVSIMRMEAEAKEPNGDWKTYPSQFPIKYAVELNGGTAAAAGIHVEDQLAIPSEARVPGNLE